MKISGKIHRGASIAAAVIMLILLLVGTGTNIISTVSLSKYYETIQLLKTVLRLVVSTIASLMMIVVLFRGKKDTVAGVLLILTVVPILVTGVIAGASRVVTYLGMMRSMAKGMVICMISASVIQIVANLVGVGFRILLAAECFKPGMIAGRKSKSIFVILPIINILMIAVSNMVQQLYMIADYGFVQYLGAAVLPAAMTTFLSIGMVIMGIAFSIPVYENNFQG